MMQSSTDDSTQKESLTGLERLERALRNVLGDQGFDEQIHTLAENQSWYTQELPSTEVFRLWAYENISHGDDPLWVFQPIRAGERKYLCDHLGIERNQIVGKSPRDLADIILIASGLPLARVSGVRTTLASWQDVVRLVDNEEDERAAIVSRQKAERLLRKILHFYCSCGYGDTFIEMLENPGKLNVPRVLMEALGADANLRILKVVELLLVDGWADLGFLAMALRKYSSRLENSSILHPSGKPLILFTQGDYDAFNKLSTALQSYTHDKPSKQASRRNELLQALRDVIETFEKMVARGIVPDELLVMAAGSTFLGDAFKGLHDSGRLRCLTTQISQMTPQLGRRVMVVATAQRDYARCIWVESPWPID
jgi:hypothetical protein